MSPLNVLASRPEPDFPVLSRLLWQALALGALVSLVLLALPLAPGGASAFGFLPFWLLAAPAAALLTLHRRFLATAWRRWSRGQITFPQAVTANPVPPGGKCALIPFSRPTPVSRRTRPSPARPGASAQAA